MNDEIKVSVVEYDDRRFYLLQWKDPITGRKKTESSKIERGGPSQYDKAVKAAGTLEEKLRAGTYRVPSKITWEAFRKRYTDEVLAGLADRTAHKVDGIFNTVETILNPQRLAHLNEQRLSYYQRTLRDEGRAEETIKGHLAHLAAALKWAADQGYIAVAPKIRKPKRAKKATRRTPMKGRPITGEEFDRMLAAIPKGLLTTIPTRRIKTDAERKHRKPTNPRPKTISPEVVESWRYYLEGLWLSGLRLEESMELYWDRPDRLMVNFSEGFPMLHIPAELEKGNQTRLMPLAPEFAEFLKKTPQDRRRGPVFNPRPRQGKGGRMRAEHVGKIVGLIGEAAGIKVRTEMKRDRKCGETSEVVKYASAHDLRRSFGVRWSTRVEAVTLMQLMRHESIETTLRYYVGRDAQATAAVLWEAHRKATGNTFGNTSSIQPADRKAASTQTEAAEEVSKYARLDSNQQPAD